MTSGPQSSEPAPPLIRRLLWFAALWAAGVAAMAILAYLIRLVVAG